jgi:hypothetical protein
MKEADRYVLQFQLLDAFDEVVDTLKTAYLQRHAEESSVDFPEAMGWACAVDLILPDEMLLFARALAVRNGILQTDYRVVLDDIVEPTNFLLTWRAWIGIRLTKLSLEDQSNVIRFQARGEQ